MTMGLSGGRQLERRRRQGAQRRWIRWRGGRRRRIRMRAAAANLEAGGLRRRIRRSGGLRRRIRRQEGCGGASGSREGYDDRRGYQKRDDPSARRNLNPPPQIPSAVFGKTMLAFRHSSHGGRRSSCLSSSSSERSWREAAARPRRPPHRRRSPHYLPQCRAAAVSSGPGEEAAARIWSVLAVLQNDGGGAVDLKMVAAVARPRPPSSPATAAWIGAGPEVVGVDGVPARESRSASSARRVLVLASLINGPRAQLFERGSHSFAGNRRS
uniref:Uncharacterized protein n=1 Tax=Oryza sativa subsp. japonica TaxID=39947 RepID=Q6YXA8_ORYSJ|nr:hypothetical protein [Oryza sativa Japonica Group]